MKKRLPFKTFSSLSIPQILLIFSILLFTGNTAFGVIKTSTTGGNWTTVTWSPAGAPGPSDDVIINTNVTINTAVSIQSLVVNSGFTLNFTGANTLAVSGTTAIAGTVTGNTTGAVTLSGALTLTGSGSLNTSTSVFTAGSTTTSSGTAAISDNSSTGSNTYIGLVTIGTSCTFTNTNNPTFEFRNGITNNGTFTISGTGLTTFSTNNQTIQGNTLTFGAVTINSLLTVSGSGSVPVNFNGALTLNGNLNLTGAGTTTFNGMTCSGAGNATIQTLVLTGATISQTGLFTVLGTTTSTGTSSISATSGLKLFQGLVTVTSGTLSSTSTAPLEFQAGLTANGTFNQSGTGTVSFTGSQTISGSGAVTFSGPVTTSANLTLSKTAGTVAFAGALTTTGNFSLASATTSTISGVGIVGGDFTTGSGTQFTIGANNFTVTGITSLSGLVVDGAVGGVDTFTGAFSILLGGELRELTGVSNSDWTFGSTVSNAGTFNNTSAGATVTFNGDVSNTGTFTRINAVSPIVLNNAIDFTSTTSINITAGSSSLVVNGATNFNFGSSNFTLGGSLTVAGTGSLAVSGTGGFTISGTTTANGPITINTGVSATFTGDVTVATGSSLTNNGTVTISSTAATALGGAGTFTNASNSILNFNGASVAITTFNAHAAGNTVNYALGTQTIRDPSSGYFNLSTAGSGSATKSLSANLVASGTVTVGNATVLQAVNFNVNTNNLTINGNGVFSKNAAGSILVQGLLTMNGSSSVVMAGNPTWEFQGGIDQNSTAGSNTGTGTVVFSTADQSINGTGTGVITFGGNVIINDGVSVSSTKSITITGTLDGAIAGAQWINDAGAGTTLTLSSATQPFLTTGTLVASANPNTVVFTSGSAQTIPAITYHHLNITGGGVKTIDNMTVNGDFIQSAGSVSCVTGSTLTFASSNAGTFRYPNGSTFINIIVNKSGGTLTLFNAALNLNVSGSLAINSGTLNFGSSAKTVTVSGDLSGAGTINLSTIANHSLVLSGVNNTIGTLTTVAGNTVTYNRAGNQTIFGSINYARLVVSGTGIKTLGGPATVADTLAFAADVLLALANNDLKLKAGARVKAGAIGNSMAAFGVNRMIVTDGTGSFIKEGTILGHLIGFAWSSAGRNNGLFPLGSTGFFTPFTLSQTTTFTIAGTGTISVRAVPAKQPNVPYFNNALVKYWEIATTNLSAISADVTFNFNVGEVIGTVGFYVPRVWDGSTLSAVAGASAPGSNPFSTTGTTFLTGSWTAIDPTVRNAYYSYISGDWNTAGTWTTDPSGTTLINSAVPTIGDQVFILNGRTVTNSASGLSTASLTIENGAVLDLASTTGHNFGPVSGSGLYRQSTVTLPTANFTAFCSSSGGTFEYYNLPAGTNVLDNSLTTYNHLLISNTTGTSFVLAQDHALVVNGDLTLTRTGAGTATFTLGNSAVARTLSIFGNLTVGTGTTFNVGLFNALHTIDLYGNLTNSGTVSLTNAAVAYTTPANGYANINFRGITSNTTVTANSGSSTRFDNFFVIKNTGYELLVTAAPGASPQFWTTGPTLTVTTGTLRLGANVVVPRLNNNGGNYEIGNSTNIPTLWIDGATVTYADGGGAIVPYGTLRVSAGTLNVLTGQGAIVVRETGQLILEGTGTINAQMFRTSNTTTTHRGSYNQSGGTLNLNGVNGGLTDFSIFSLGYPDNVFRMSGGTINITRAFLGGVTPNGGFQVGSTAGNFDVTGGTINVTITPSATFHFDISSTAPLYNLNINRTPGAGGTVRLNSIAWFGGTASAQPLTILNDFTIDGTNSPIFNAQNSDVFVKGNMTVNNGGTYQSTTNTTTFNGTANQTFTVNGSLGTGLSSLTIDKVSSSLTVAGSASTITVRGNLTIAEGTLADGGKTINVAQNITNNGTHSGSGKIALNGSTSSQTITGTLNSVFGNIDFSNTNGAAGSTQITVSSNLQINGNLGLTTDRIANIGNRQIILSGSSSITGTFSANRHIKTNGLLSDGGIRKTFSSTAAITFPLGYGTNYAPATIQFTSTPTTWGSLDVRPVGTKQLYVTDPNCFDLYWKIKTTGFSGIPANSVNYTFNYGSLTDDASYIPAFYDQIAIAYTTINDVTRVDEATNNISFSGVSYTDGDYTAGNPAAFGIVIPFYSRANGNWNNPSTWSNVTFGGTPAVSLPSSNSPVLIGDGNLFNHTVTVTSNGTIAGSLIVDAGSTLDCQTTTGNNFGAIPYATAGGSGTIRISSATATAEFPAGDFGLFFESTGGTTEYYSTGTQDFTLPSSTASPTVISIDTYRNLTLAPGSGRTITLPNKNYTIYNDLVVNGNATGVAQLTDAAALTITVNHDLRVEQGILEFGSAFSQTVNVLSDASVNNGGTIRTVNSGSIVHNINLDGNLFNEGVISLNNASKSNLTFQNSGSKVFNGSNASSSVSLSSLTINKGSSFATELEISTLGTFSAPSNGWLNLVNGNLKWSKSGTITLTNVAGDFTIPSTAALTLNNSGLTVNVNQVNSSDADVILLGKLSIQAGTMNIGNNANNQHNDLEVGPSGIPELEIGGTGVLNVNGQIRRSLVVQLGSLKYTQSGSSTVLVRGKNPDPANSLSHDKAKFEILNAGSEFNMSGTSTLTIDRNGQPSGVYYDIYLNPSSFNITGGEIRVGNGTSLQTFFIDAISPVWNLSVDGALAQTLRLIGDPIVVQNNLRIEGNSVFIANGLNVTVGGNLVNLNTTNTSGLSNGGFQPTTSTQTTTFNSSTANQTITGTGTNLTNFANLVIQNTFTSGQVSMSANTATRVAGQLSINSGLLNTGANNLTLIGNVVNNGGHTSTGSGFLVFGGSSSQSIQSSSTAAFGSLRFSNSAGIVASAPVDVSGTLDFVNGLFYINNHLLSLGVSSTISGSLSSSSMIRLNGVTSDAGVRKSYPASASDFTFPIGTTLKYTPARFNVTSNTVAGTITIKPVNIKHPATTDPLDLQLGYYWRVNSTGFNGSTVVNHTYNYEPLDVTGTETSYVTGRFFGSIWAPTLGIPATVDATNDRFTLTGVNYFDGDYTAGESTEFNIITTFYSRNATGGGNWDDPNAWSIDGALQHAGAAAPTFPNFNQAVIAAGHTVNAVGNNRNAVSVVVDGTLNLGNTIAHNFGDVTGTGRIVQTATLGGQYIFPGGNYSAFTNSGGGTFEFGGVINGTLSTQGVYNNIEFTGPCTKSLANTNITVNGNFTISASVVVNPSNRNISLNGNWINTVGIGGFSAGSGAVSLTGNAQTITGATNFHSLATVSAGTKTLTSSITATNNLTLTDGIFSTGGNQITLNAGASVTGGSSASYVNGNLRRGIPASATTTIFQIGDGTAYTPATINFTGTTAAGGFISAFTSAGDHPQVYTSGIDQTKSANRFWTLTNSGVTGFTGYNASFTFVPGDLDVSANPLNFIPARYSGTVWTQPTVGTITSTSTQGISISGTTFGDFQVGQSVGGKIWTGTTNTNWNIATNWIPASIPGTGDNAIIGNVPNQPTFTSGGNGQCKDLILLSGATVTIPTGYTLTVEENIDAAGNTVNGVGTLAINGASSTLTGTLTTNARLVVNNSATLILGGGSTLNVGTDLTVNGSLTHNNLPVHFTGSNNSVVSGNIGLYDLIVNKSSSSNTVSLGSNITVSNEVNLLSGDVELNGFDLDLGTTGSIVNETSDNRVTGLTGGTIRATRNLNAPSSVNVGGLGAVLSSAANMGSTEVIRKHNQVVFGIGFGTNRRYEIHPTNNSALNATFVFNYFEDELVTTEGNILEAELDLWRFNGTTWDVQNATLNTTANTITKTGIPQFSEWTAGSEVNNPLAVELAFVQVACSANTPSLVWKTLTETDVRYFNVQGSHNGKDWQTLGVVSPTGDKTTGRQYSFSMDKLPSGIRLVRLTATDLKGDHQTFPSLPIQCGKEVPAPEISVYPNPGDGLFTLDLKGSVAENMELKVINVFGQTIAGAIHNGQRSDKIKMDLRGLPAGIYKVQITDESNRIRTSVNVVLR